MNHTLIFACVVLNSNRLTRPSGKGAGRGRPYSEMAEELGKACIGLGISDNKCAQLFSIQNLLIWKNESFDTQSSSWFQHKRTQGGVEATAYVWFELLQADNICQLGYDETKIDRISH